MIRHLLLVVVACTLVACGSSRSTYDGDGSRPRNIVKAEEVYQEAVASLDDQDAEADEAKHLLQEALGYDLYHGPAHNNLGVLFLREGKLYEAAEEFEWARKLLPGHPEPRVNLAIVLSRGGRTADALDAARSALEIRPGHLPAIQALAWIQVNEGIADAKTLDHLNAIATRSSDETWRSWALDRRDALSARQHQEP